MNVTYTYQPTDWSYNLSSYSGNPGWLDRGVTGHEMLREFNLINMNARIYDPIIARMLQPDNYVQDATYTQNYNRYSYVLNNPARFTDPSGDFVVVDSWIIGFVHGFFSTNYNRGGAAWNEANHRAGNDARIWGGLFVTNPNKSTGGRMWENTGRFRRRS